jgi:hypothetical protein
MCPRRSEGLDRAVRWQDAVEDRGVRADGVRDLDLELWKLRVDVPAARDECAVMPVDLRQRAESVVFELEDPIRMIERPCHANQRHWSQMRTHPSSIMVTGLGRRAEAAGMPENKVRKKPPPRRPKRPRPKMSIREKVLVLICLLAYLVLLDWGFRTWLVPLGYSRYAVKYVFWLTGTIGLWALTKLRGRD